MTSDAPGPRLARYVLTVAALAAVYFLAARFGLSLATVAEQVSPVWPPTGIAIAAVLLLGVRVWPGIAIGAFAANALVNETPLTAAGIACGNTLEAVLAAVLLSRFVHFQCALQRTKDMVGFAISGACLGPAVSATIGVTSLCLGGAADWGKFGLLWLTWWFGDAMGAILVAPPLLTFAHWLRSERQIARVLEFSVFLAAACVGSLLVLVDPGVEMAHLTYLVFPLFLWSGLRFQQFLTAMALVMVSGVALWGVDWRSDAFPAATMNSRLLLMQTFVGTLALSSLTLGAVTAELRKVAETYRESQERLSAIFHQVISGVAQMDLEGRFLMVNDRLCAIANRSRDELLGACWPDLAHPDDRAAQAGLLERCAGQGAGFADETRLLTPDGRQVWVSNHVSAVRDANGRPVHLVAVVQDISDRKEAEERRRLLFAELNHRVKNTLATVLSIVSRTSASAVDRPQFQRDLEARLKSLAETHSILMHQDWAGAELAAIAERELRPHGAERDGRVRLEGPPVYLTPRAAMSLHLVLHELATNAAKYGALSAPGGRLDVTWGIEPHQAGEQLQLRWKESGGPRVKPPTRRGFGSTVIEEAVQYELDGRTSPEYLAEGFQYELVVPFTADVGRLLEPRPAARGVLLLAR